MKFRGIFAGAVLALSKRGFPCPGASDRLRGFGLTNLNNSSVAGMKGQHHAQRQLYADLPNAGPGAADFSGNSTAGSCHSTRRQFR